ncbi:zinc finger, CCHC-type containing protein [Tanacetum coccineum]
MVEGISMEEMTTNFGKLDKIERHDFRRWQKKIHFLFTTLKVVYALSTPMPELLVDDTPEAVRLMAADASSKKFLVSNFNNYMMVGSRPVMEQFNEIFRILGQYTQHSLKMDESISISSVIYKLPPFRKDFKHRLKHGKEVVGPSVNMIEGDGSNKNDKQNKGKKRGFKDNNGGSGSNKKPKVACWKCGKTGQFKKDLCSGNKKDYASVNGSRNGLMQLRSRLIPVLQLMFVMIVAGFRHMNRIIHETMAYTPQQNGVAEKKNKALKEMVNAMLSSSGLSDRFGGEAMFGGVGPLLDFWTLKEKLWVNRVFIASLLDMLSIPRHIGFDVIEPNDSISINTIIESRDAIFDKNHFSSIPRPNYIISNYDKSSRDDNSNDIPNEIPGPHKSKRARKAKAYGSEF